MREDDRRPTVWRVPHLQMKKDSSDEGEQCDANKPLCQRCQADGKICEGYVRYNTYVNKTAQGLQKRRRLEEVIPPMQLPQPSLQGRMAAVAFSSVAPSVNDVTSREHQDRATINPLQKGNFTDRSLLEAFLNLYLPSAPENRNGATIAWLSKACSFPEPSPLLQVALHALAANRVAAGSIYENNDLAPTSLHYYGKSLQTLNELLSFPEALFDDQTLAAIRCLMIYEVVATCLLMDTRNVTEMIASIANCVRSPLGEEQWRLSTDIQYFSDAEHSFYDLAFDIAAVYEQDDSAHSSDQTDPAQNARSIRQLDAIVSKLVTLIEALKDLRPAEAFHNSTEYWDLESAILLANSRTMVLDMSMTIRDVSLRTEGLGEDSAFLAPVIEKHDVEEGQLAKQILHALRYATGDHMGLYGGQKSLFALRILLHHLRGYGGAVYAETRGMYDNLLSRRGLRHTLDLNRERGMLSPMDGK